MSRRHLIFPLALIAFLALTTSATAVQRVSAQKAEQLTVAPMNPDFLSYRVEDPLGAIQWATVGSFGEMPTPQDFSYARGLATPVVHNQTYAASYDLRTLGRVTPVKDQNPYGTCWSFASLGSLESCLLPGETRDFSEDNMILTNGFDYDFSVGPYNNGGTYLMSTAYLVRWSGPVNESEDAYGDHYTPAMLVPSKHVQDVSWFAPRATANDNDNVKSAVSTYGGVYAAMYMDGSSSYYNATTHAYYYNGGSPTNQTNHAVLIVGWDDSYPASRFASPPPGSGAFIVKNSWGTGWGESGYFYVSYYDTEFGMNSLFAVFNGAQATSNYTGIYQYDPLGDTYSCGYGSSTGWFANVFTAQSTTLLRAVGFYSLTPNTSYEVYTGSSLATKTLSTSGTLATMGYHTVALLTPVAVTSGQPFVVAVKVTSPGINYPIAIEYPISGYSSSATASAGQSYVSSDGSSWYDSTTYLANTNVCLKAYTAGTDTTAPTTTANGVDGKWHKKPVTATFIAVDNTGGSGMIGGFAKTEYQLDYNVSMTGTSCTVAAPANHSGDGVHTLAYYSTDADGNVEFTKRGTIKIDTTGPLTAALRVISVRSGKSASFAYKVTDKLSAKAKVTLKIYNKNGKLAESVALGAKKTDANLIYKLRVNLAKGSYKYRIYATDLAGNAQRKAGVNRLVVE